jgi:hypothetical protein
MTLFEIIGKLDELPEETYICARRPWRPDADALLVPFPEDLRIPQEMKAQGYEYFLEVSTACEILEGFIQSKPTPIQVADFIIYYAGNDAFPEGQQNL